MYQHESIYFCLFSSILALYLCSFTKVNCDNDLQLRYKDRNANVGTGNTRIKDSPASIISSNRMNMQTRNVREQIKRLNRGSIRPNRRNQENNGVAKKTEQARQRQKQMEKTQNKTEEKQKQKEVNKQRDTLRDKKMDKRRAMGKVRVMRTPSIMPQEDAVEDSTRVAIPDLRHSLGNDEADLETLKPHSLARQLTKLMARAEYTNVTVTTIGKTVEFNDIVLLKASDIENVPRSYKDFNPDNTKYAEDIPQKKIIFIVHGLTLMGFKDIPCLIRVKKFLQLLKAYFNHLNKFDIYVVPMANPDGVSYSYQVPLWNKNVSPQDACPGVALDRNFDIIWNGGASVKSCSQQYPGEHPFSELETVAIREVLHKNSHKIVAFIHVHAGGFHEHIYRGDAVLYPRGYTEVTSDDDKYIDMKGEIEDTIRNASFKVMTMSTESLYEWYGKVTGSSVDYASTVYGIPFSLEFVMQVYDRIPPAENSAEDIASIAQSEIWHRIINTVFKYIFKVTKKKTAEDARRENALRSTPPPHIGF